MNCDQVFDVLTRGPFPTGHAGTDEAVETHLGQCSDCARLATALRPAVDLLTEAIGSDESRALPAYWGELVEVPHEAPVVGSATSPAPVITTPRLRHRQRRAVLPGFSSAGRLAAAVLLGLALGGALADWDRHTVGPRASDGDASPRFEAHAAAISTGGDETTGPSVRGLESLHVVAACLEAALGLRGEAVSADDRTLALADFARGHCCTDCHGSLGSVRASTAGVTRIAQSCQVCHVE